MKDRNNKKVKKNDHENQKRNDSSVDEYVPTNHLFFPILEYASLKEQRMKIEFTMIHFHQIRIEYAFNYFANMALFGGCISSTNCVKIYA